MALSRTNYIGNGSQTDYTTPPYIKRTHITVKLNGIVTSAFTWIGPTTIRFTSAPASGVDILIQRTTSPAERLVDYTTPGNLSEEDLDTDSLQAFYLAQESADAVQDAIDAVAGSGNVPAPTSSDISKVLRAIAAGSFSWQSLGALADKNTVATADIDNGAVTHDKLNSGTVIGRAFGEYTANANLTAVIPADGTQPLATEGTEILSVAYTVKRAASRIRFRFMAEGAATSASVGLVASVFQDVSGVQTFQKATFGGDAAAAGPGLLVVEYEYTHGQSAGTALTLRVRVGPNVASTARLNGGTTASAFAAGNQSATLVIEEIRE